MVSTEKILEKSVLEWIERAEQDINVANIMKENKNYEYSCFFSQQTENILISLVGQGFSLATSIKIYLTTLANLKVCPTRCMTY